MALYRIVQVDGQPVIEVGIDQLWWNMTQQMLNVLNLLGARWSITEAPTGHVLRFWFPDPEQPDGAA